MNDFSRHGVALSRVLLAPITNPPTASAGMLSALRRFWHDSWRGVHGTEARMARASASLLPRFTDRTGAASEQQITSGIVHGLLRVVKDFLRARPNGDDDIAARSAMHPMTIVGSPRRCPKPLARPKPSTARRSRRNGGNHRGCHPTTRSGEPQHRCRPTWPAPTRWRIEAIPDRQGTLTRWSGDPFPYRHDRSSRVGSRQKSSRRWSRRQGRSIPPAIETSRSRFGVVMMAAPPDRGRPPPLAQGSRPRGRRRATGRAPRRRHAPRRAASAEQPAHLAVVQIRQERGLGRRR